MPMENWIAAASLGLFALFGGEMASIYHYMLTSPTESEFGIVFEPDPKILQFISIGAAPASIMAAVSFLLSKRYGSRLVGSLIVGGGISMLLGMAYCHSISPMIDPIYVTTATEISPPVFMLVSAPVMLFGALLFRTRAPRRRKTYV